MVWDGESTARHRPNNWRATGSTCLFPGVALVSSQTTAWEATLLCKTYRASGVTPTTKTQSGFAERILRAACHARDRPGQSQRQPRVTQGRETSKPRLAFPCSQVTQVAKQVTLTPSSRSCRQSSQVA